MLPFSKVLAICVLDGIMLLTIPRLENAELLMLCDAMRHYCA